MKRLVFVPMVICLGIFHQSGTVNSQLVNTVRLGVLKSDFDEIFALAKKGNENTVTKIELGETGDLLARTAVYKNGQPAYLQYLHVLGPLTFQSGILGQGIVEQLKYDGSFEFKYQEHSINRPIPKDEKLNPSEKEPHLDEKDLPNEISLNFEGKGEKKSTTGETEPTTNKEETTKDNYELVIRKLETTESTSRILRYFEIQHLHKLFRKLKRKEEIKGKACKLPHHILKYVHCIVRKEFKDIVRNLQNNELKIRYDVKKHRFYLKHPLKCLSVETDREENTHIKTVQNYFDVAYDPESDTFFSSAGPLPKDKLLVRQDTFIMSQLPKAKDKEDILESPTKPRHIPQEILITELAKEKGLEQKRVKIVNFVDTALAVQDSGEYRYVEGVTLIVKKRTHVQTFHPWRILLEYGERTLQYIMTEDGEMEEVEEEDEIEVPITELADTFKKHHPNIGKFLTYGLFRPIRDLLQRIYSAAKWGCDRDEKLQGWETDENFRRSYQILNHGFNFTVTMNCKKEKELGQHVMVMRNVVIVDANMQMELCNVAFLPATEKIYFDCDLENALYIYQDTTDIWRLVPHTSPEYINLHLFKEAFQRIRYVLLRRKSAHLRNYLSTHTIGTGVISIDEKYTSFEISPGISNKIVEGQDLLIVRGDFQVKDYDGKVIKRPILYCTEELMHLTNTQDALPYRMAKISLVAEYKLLSNIMMEKYVAEKYVTLKKLFRHLNLISEEILFRCDKIGRNVRFVVDVTYWGKYKLQGGLFDCAEKFFLFEGDGVSKSYEFLKSYFVHQIDEDYIKEARAEKFIYFVEGEIFVPESEPSSQKSDLFAVKLITEEHGILTDDYGAPITIDNECSFALKI